MKRHIFTSLLLLGLFSAVIAWGREDRLANTGFAPAAEGRVVTKNDRNGNTRIEIHVKHMARPQALIPSKSGYVVWLQAPGKPAETLGTLRVNEDLEGSL